MFCYNFTLICYEQRYSPNIDHLRAQNCFALNFGWPVEITLPSISLSLNSKNPFDFETIRKTAPSNCFIVMVGGRTLARMDQIVRKVDEITAQWPIKVLAYFGEKSEVVPMKDLENLPAIVRHIRKFYYNTYIDILNYKVLIPKQNNRFGISFNIFCPRNPYPISLQMFMFHNGSVKDNINFKEMCPIKQKAQMAKITFSLQLHHTNGIAFYDWWRGWMVMATCF